MKRLLLSLTFAWLYAAGPVHAAVLEEFQSADWSGAAYSDDSSGAFQQCSVFTRYQHGTTLMFSLYEGERWAVTLINGSWTLTPQQNYPVRYRVDNRGFGQADAAALDPTRLVFYPGSKEKLIDQVRRGKKLTAEIQGRTYEFELSNSRKALASAEECVERHIRTAAAAATSGSEGADQKASDAVTLGERQTFGQWVVTATADESGKFSNCTAFGLMPKDEQLILSYAPDGLWEFGIYRPAWSLKPGETYILSYNVDAPAEGPTAIGRAVDVPEAQRILFVVSPMENVIDRVTQARELHVRLTGPGLAPEDLVYPLDRANEALAAAKACTEKNSAPAQASAAAAVVPEPADSATAEPPSAVAEAEAGQDAARGAAAAPADPSVIENFQVGPWAGFAYRDESGAFSHCTVALESPGGAAMFVGIRSDGGRVFSMRNTEWKLTPGNEYDVSYGITSRSNETTAASLKASATSVDQWIVALGEQDPLFDRLAEGVAFAVFFENGEYAFDLVDSEQVMSRLQVCASQHGTVATEAPTIDEPAVADVSPSGGAAQQQAADVGTGTADTEKGSSPVPPELSTAEEKRGFDLPPLGEKQIETKEVPGWTVGAYADANSNAFTHCSILAEYENGTTFAVGRAAGGSILVALHRTDWWLALGKRSPLRYQLAGGEPVEAVGEAISPQIFAASLGSGADIAAALSGATEMVVDAHGRSLTFDISDIRPAFEELDACVERHRPEAAPAAAGGSPAKASSKKKQKDAVREEAPQQKAEAVATPEANAEAVSLLPVGNMEVNTTRGLSTPYTLIYPKDVLQELASGNAEAGLNHPTETFQCDLNIDPVTPGYSVPQAIQAFDKAQVETERRREFPDFTLLDHGEEAFQSGPALFYTADLTSKAPGAEPLRLVHTEAAEGGRLYQLDCYMARDIVEQAIPLAVFLIRNFSTNAEGKCCVDPTANPG